MILNIKVEIISREFAINNKDYLILFTDNANRTSGKILIDPNCNYTKEFSNSRKLYRPTMTQAVVRGLDNCFPISTMKTQNRIQWLDFDFDLFKETIDHEFNYINNNIEHYNCLIYSGQFGNGRISQMKISSPKCWNYLNQKLLTIGINNKF